MPKNKCVNNCGRLATNGVYCAKCIKLAHAKFAHESDAAPKGTFKKTTVGRVKVIQAGNA